MASTQFPHEALATEPVAWSNTHSSGISWGAVIGGAVVAAALSLIMMALGAGFGLSVVSPWSGSGPSASAIGTAAILWLLIIQAVSWSLGGYLTGRFRTRWISVHSDEVYFRDTANGFLAWAVGLVISATLLVASAASIGAATQGYDASAQGPGSVYDPKAYFVDMLFRSDHAVPAVVDAAAQAEAARIVAASLVKNEISQEDHVYLARMVATRTGLAYADADKRVTAVIAEARQAEDAARKTTAHALLWVFVALLTGAFCASFAATIGGRQRDHVRAI